VIATFPKRRNPAAPELLGSKGVGGAEHFDRQTDNDQEDTSPVYCFQSFQARCEMVQDHTLPQCGSDRALLSRSTGRLP
jgi:hypothetical protein